MNWKQITAWILFSLVASVVCCKALEAEKATDAEKKAYETAYSFVTEENWSEALPALEAFIQKYPDGVYTDDAGYWYCYTLEKSDEDPEACYDCYEEFMEKYEDSNWIKTAKSRQIILSKKLEKLGKKEYAEELESYKENGDSDIVIEAIYALASRNSDKSVEKLLDIYKKKDSKRIRDAVVFALYNSPSAKAQDFLFEIAKIEKDPKAQKNAIFWVGQKGGERAMKLLQEIIYGNYSIEVRKEAIFTIASGSDSDNEKRVDILLDIMKKVDNSRLKNETIFYLGQKKSPKVIKFFEEQAFANNSLETLKALVFALHENKTPESLDLLIKIAKKHPNMKIRKEAIFWLGESKDEKALKAIEEIIDEM
jgi:HEAT repeat protein